MKSHLQCMQCGCQGLGAEAKPTASPGASCVPPVHPQSSESTPGSGEKVTLLFMPLTLAPHLLQP